MLLAHTLAPAVSLLRPVVSPIYACFHKSFNFWTHVGSIFAVSISVSLSFSIVFIEGSTILLGCTRLPVLPVLFFVIALLHETNIRLSALSPVRLFIKLRGFCLWRLCLGMNAFSCDLLLLDVSWYLFCHCNLICPRGGTWTHMWPVTLSTRYKLEGILAVMRSFFRGFWFCGN